MFLRDIFNLRQADNRLFSLNLKHGFAVGILPVIYIHFFTCLSCTHRQHAVSDSGITWKYSTRKVLVATLRQYWYNTNTQPTHQQLLQLVTVIQERYIVEEKLRFVKRIRPLKWSNKKIRWRCTSFSLAVIFIIRCTSLNKTMHIVSKQGIKGADIIMVNLRAGGQLHL